MVSAVSAYENYGSPGNASEDLRSRPREQALSDRVLGGTGLAWHPNYPPDLVDLTMWALGRKQCSDGPSRY